MLSWGWSDGVGNVYLGGGSERYLSAYLLKPLFVRVANECALGEIVVRFSDNQACDYVIEYSGGLDVILDRIYKRGGVKWLEADSRGRISVSAEEVMLAYLAFQRDGSCNARRVVRWMRDLDRE